MKTISYLFAVIGLLLCSSCSKKDRLPILGEKTFDTLSGEYRYYQTPDFNLINQLDEKVTSKDFQGKIQVVDFFFTSCPTICPKMTTHLKLVEEAFEKEDGVALISYSIDSQNDTPERLRQYAKSYNINNDKWAFLTGNSETIFELSKDYKVRAFDDSSPQGTNLIHDGTFVLVDGELRIRGYYNGLDKEDTLQLINDIKILLKEYPNEIRS
ncbi:MAG: SCO family protein [Flavobacteriaceae bacterium]|nr:SCO family protein [Flavobacteriaceae bacterium]